MKFDTLCQEAKLGATRNNWITTKNAFGAVFKTLSAYDVGALIMVYVKLYLPRFMEKNPQETWVNERLLIIKQVFDGEMASDMLPGFPDYTRKLGDPLARGFVSAIGSLWRMAQRISNSDLFAESAADTISMIFTLLRYEYSVWLPAGYEHLRNEDTGSLEYQIDLWCDLADKLGKLASNNERHTDRP
jgi:hypothetical protein